MSSAGPFYTNIETIEATADDTQVAYRVVVSNTSTLNVSVDVRAFASIGRTFLLDETVEEILTPDEELEIKGQFDHNSDPGDEISMCARVTDENPRGIS